MNASADDMTQLVSSFATCTPGDDVCERMVSLLGSHGEHLAALGIHDAAALDQFIRTEMHRPLGSAQDVPGRARGVGAKVSFAFVALIVLVGSALGIRFLGARSTDGPTVTSVHTSMSEPVPGTGTGDDEAPVLPDRSSVSGTALDISVSDGQACSLLTNGVAACWGSGINVGDQDVTDMSDAALLFDPRPFEIQGGPFQSIDINPNGTGLEVVCGVHDGKVACRGLLLSDVQQSSNANRSDELFALPTVSDATIVTVGTKHACALLIDRTVRCWGGNSMGQRGSGNFEDSDQFVVARPSDLTDVVAVEAGGDRTCALKSDGTTWCWGLDEPPFGRHATPHQVEGLPPLAQIGTGSDVTCGVDEDSRMWCWGDFESAFGIRDTSVFTPPRTIDIPAPVRQVVPKNGGVCAVDTSGLVWCTESGTAEFKQVLGVEGVEKLAAKGGLSCALSRDGAVSCWGPMVQWPHGEGDTPEIVRITGLGS